MSSRKGGKRDDRKPAMSGNTLRMEDAPALPDGHKAYKIHIEGAITTDDAERIIAAVPYVTATRDVATRDMTFRHVATGAIISRIDHLVANGDALFEELPLEELIYETADHYHITHAITGVKCCVVYRQIARDGSYVSVCAKPDNFPDDAGFECIDGVMALPSGATRDQFARAMAEHEARVVQEPPRVYVRITMTH